MASCSMTTGGVVRARSRGARHCVAVAVVIIVSACATAPVVPPVVPASPVDPARASWEEKLTWILRLEDQRLVRDPNPPPPMVLVPATATRPALLAPPPPSDLIRLLSDEEGRVRRRAALALGRVGLLEGVGALAERLQSDEEFEVRQMAAFALGLIGAQNGRTPLLAALNDPDPTVQGRAAEALGLIGSRDDAPAVSAMVAAHIRAGVLAGIQPDSLEPSPAPAVDAVRLGIYALVRLGSYDALAAATLDASGQPVSRWWPIAYALQRIGDPRASTPLLALLPTPGRYTAAFAAKGLAALKTGAAAEPLRRIVEARQVPRAVLIQSIRALAALADTESAPALQRVIIDPRAEMVVRLEALDALGFAGTRANVDLLLDLMSDTFPGIRGGAMRALARLDPEMFITTLSGLDPDREWTVRVAQVNALATLPQDMGGPRLLAMLQDRDQRVTAAVLPALVATKSPQAARVLTEKLAADDFGTRAAAAAGLAELRVTAAVPALVAAYRSAFGDSTYVARAATLAALHRLDPMAARPLLEEALMDREWVVRLRAAALLEEQGVTPTSAIRPATPSKPVTDPSWQGLLNPQFSPHAFVETDRGVIEIELAVNDAPQTVANFIALAVKGFFNGIPIHRVVPDFVVQAGDPRGDGEGGPGYTIRDELNERPYLRGTVGMALDWKDTGGSQFFITHSPQPHLDARYTAFGTVVDGMDVAEQLVPWDVIRRVRIWDGVTMTP
jgi:cyclophilin family peptidyl-prolyl cis-trans isomerase/HEAT repeat protein